MFNSLERVLPVPSNSAGIKTAMATIVVIISHLVGGWSPTMWTLGIIMILDMITGFIRAAHQHVISSTEMSWRGIKKLLTVALVILAAQLDYCLGGGEGHVLRDALIIYYIVVEALSILENTAACGVPYPEWLVTVLKQLNERKAQPSPPSKT